MAFPGRVYAFPSNKFAGTDEKPAAAKRSVAALKQERRELDRVATKQKQAVDRANILLDRLEDRQAAISGQIAGLQRSKQVCAERAARIEDRLVQELEAWGLTRADGFRTSVVLTPSPASVEVFDASLLPADYWRQPKTPEKQPDKVAIKKALAESKRVPGARLTQGSTLKRSGL
jgi:hypothetical protein